MATGTPPSLDAKDSLLLAVLKHVREASPYPLPSDLSYETELDALGLDSLARMDIVNRIEKEFHIRFPEQDLYDIATIADLVSLLAAMHGHPPTESLHVEKVAPPITATAIVPNERHRWSEVEAFEARRSGILESGVAIPFFRSNEQVSGPMARIAGQDSVSFTSFDYLGMARDPRVADAACRAIARFGTSASASRLVGGNSTTLEELDDELARFIGTEAAVAFPSGYGTNASVLGHLFGENDLILYDELAHNSIVQGSALSAAKRRPFPHNDFEFVEAYLSDVRRNYRRVAIALEGVYSMDGDYPDLPGFISVKQRFDAVLYIDEAHSLGVMGKTGRGICEHFGVSAREVDLLMGTISKSLGSCGGYLAGDKSLINYLKFTTPSMVFSTAAPPASAAAALESIRVLVEQPHRLLQLRENAQLFLKLAKDAGLNTGASCNTPIIPVILGDSRLCLWMSQELLHRGINAQPILYPAVPESASRMRFFITALHTEEQIHAAVQAVSDLMQP